MILKSLFGKIFLCFLLAHILASLLTYAYMTATRPQPRSAQWSGQQNSVRNSFRPRRFGPPRRMQRKYELLRWITIFAAATGVSYGLARYLAVAFFSL